MSEEDQDEIAEQADIASSSKISEKKKKKPLKPGIVYLSSIPYFVTVRRCRDLLGKYGEIGQIYLASETRINSAGKKQKRYVEGWIEFKDKRVAKRLAASLNNMPVGGKRRSKAREALWNLKYLHRFKWIHLSEQIAYEKAIRQQKLRTEISQAKRQAENFVAQIEKGKNLRKLEEQVLKKGGLWETFKRQIEQKKVKADGEKMPADKNQLLDMVFAGEEEEEEEEET